MVRGTIRTLLFAGCLAGGYYYLQPHRKQPNVEHTPRIDTPVVTPPEPPLQTTKEIVIPKKEELPPVTVSVIKKREVIKEENIDEIPEQRRYRNFLFDEQGRLKRRLFTN